MIYVSAIGDTVLRYVASREFLKLEFLHHLQATIFTLEYFL